MDLASDLQQELIKRQRNTPIVFITGHGDIPTSVKAMKAGAVDFLPKPFKTADLLDAVCRAIKKHKALVEEDLQKKKLHKRVDTLTVREKEVYRWIIRGLLNKQIARKLGITEKTVKVHRGRVMKKMQVRSVAELVHLSEILSLLPAKEKLT